MSANFTGGRLASRVGRWLDAHMMATRPPAVEDDRESGEHYNCDKDDLLHENLLLAGTFDWGR